MTIHDDVLKAMQGVRSLEGQIAAVLAGRGLLLVQHYRHGPYKLEILFSDGANSYWTRSTSVVKERAWTQEELDDCLARQIIAEVDIWIAGKRAAAR